MKTVITLIFKLKALVIGNKFDLGGDVQIKFNVNVIIIMTSILTSTCLTSIVILHYHRVRWCKLHIYRICGPSDLSVAASAEAVRKKVYTGRGKWPT